MLRENIPVPVPHLKFCLDDRVEILDLPRVMADQDTRIEGLVEDHQSRVKLPSSESNPAGNRIRIQPDQIRVLNYRLPVFNKEVCEKKVIKDLIRIMTVVLNMEGVHGHGGHPVTPKTQYP